PDLTLPGAADTRVVELEEPRDPSQRGWFLLARYAETPPRGALSGRQEVVQRIDENLVFTKAYEIEFYDFYELSHSLVPKVIRIPVTAGGNGEDIIDRFKWRVDFSLFWGLYRRQFDEQHVN